MADAQDEAVVDRQHWPPQAHIGQDDAELEVVLLVTDQKAALVAVLENLSARLAVARNSAQDHHCVSSC